MSMQIHGKQLKDDSINIGGGNNKLVPDGDFSMGTNFLKQDNHPIVPEDLVNKDYVDEFKANKTTSGFVATISVGGVSAGSSITEGTDLEQLARALLTPYQPPTFSGFTVNFDISGIVEVGQTVNVTNVTWSATNDSDGNIPSNKSILGVGFEPATVVTTSPHIADATVKSVVKNTATSETWTIRGYDKNSNLISRSYTKIWRFRFYFGASTTLVTDDTTADAVIDALQQSNLQANKISTYYATSDNNNGDNYTYIAYPSSFGDLTQIIQNDALPVITAFTKLGDYNHSNIQGFTSSYRVYRSNAKGAFANGTKLSIT